MAELHEHFSSQIEELDRTLCFLNLISCTEARFRKDFLTRVYNRKKDHLSLAFRNIYAEKENHVSLEEDILENWKLYVDASKSAISAFIGALKFRHWLAHGRYWVPNLGRKYDFLDVYAICSQIEGFEFIE